MSEEAAPNWETCKENVVPIKRGRSAKGLSENLEKNVVSSTSIDKLREKVFEDALITSTSKSPKDLLDTYVTYFKWIRDAYPSNTEQPLKILERCTVDLKDESALKNDVRFVKMWIEYADMVRTPGEIFSFMQSNKIGETVALFWIAWAFVAEKLENFKLADQIFQKGIKKQAEPKELLSKRFQQFQRRLARHYINLAESGALNENGETAQTQQKDSRAALSRISSSQAAGTDRRPGALPNGPINNENVPRTTTAVAMAPQQAARSAAHVSSSSSSSRSSSRPLPGSSVVPTSRGPPSASTMATSTSISNNSRFEIFSDAAVPSGGVETESALLTENPNWSNIGTEAGRRKENDGPITIWSEGPLLQPKPTSTRGQPLPQLIPVFVDEKFLKEEQQQSDDNGGNKEEEDEEERARKISRPALNIRKQLDGGLDRIASNPLERHKASSTSTAAAAAAAIATAATAAVPIPAAGGASQHSSSSTSSSSSSSSSRDKIAQRLAEMKASSGTGTMVSSSSAKPSAAAAAAGSVPFAIFSDDSLAPPQGKPTCAPPAATTNNNDDRRRKRAEMTGNNAQPPPPATSSSSSSFSSSSASSSSSSMPFSIFSDDAVSSTSSVPADKNKKDVSLRPSSSSASSTAAAAAVPVGSATSASTSTTSASASAFTIFSDEPIAIQTQSKAQTKKPSAKEASKPSDPPPVKGTGGASFEIFSDSSASVPVPSVKATESSEVAVAAVLKKKPLESALKAKLPSKVPQDEHEDDLNDILNAMGVLDGEDGTINTRLARKDIDSMFCSPGNSMDGISPIKRGGGGGAVRDNGTVGSAAPKLFQFNPFKAHADAPKSFGKPRSAQTPSIAELSVIKESSGEDFSIFGQLATPGITSRGHHGGCTTQRSGIPRHTRTRNTSPSFSGDGDILCEEDEDEEEQREGCDGGDDDCMQVVNRPRGGRSNNNDSEEPDGNDFASILALGGHLNRRESGNSLYMSSSSHNSSSDASRDSNAREGRDKKDTKAPSSLLSSSWSPSPPVVYWKPLPPPAAPVVAVPAISAVVVDIDLVGDEDDDLIIGGGDKGILESIAAPTRTRTYKPLMIKSSKATTVGMPNKISNGPLDQRLQKEVSVEVDVAGRRRHYIGTNDRRTVEEVGGTDRPGYGIAAGLRSRSSKYMSNGAGGGSSFIQDRRSRLRARELRPPPPPATPSSDEEEGDIIDLCTPEPERHMPSAKNHMTTNFDDGAIGGFEGTEEEEDHPVTLSMILEENTVDLESSCISTTVIGSVDDYGNGLRDLYINAMDTIGEEEEDEGKYDDDPASASAAAVVVSTEGVVVQAVSSLRAWMADEEEDAAAVVVHEDFMFTQEVEVETIRDDEELITDNRTGYCGASVFDDHGNDSPRQMPVPTRRRTSLFRMRDKKHVCSLQVLPESAAAAHKHTQYKPSSQKGRALAVERSTHTKCSTQSEDGCFPVRLSAVGGLLSSERQGDDRTPPSAPEEPYSGGGLSGGPSSPLQHSEDETELTENTTRAEVGAAAISSKRTRGCATDHIQALTDSFERSATITASAEEVEEKEDAAKEEEEEGEERVATHYQIYIEESGVYEQSKTTQWKQLLRELSDVVASSVLPAMRDVTSAEDHGLRMPRLIDNRTVAMPACLSIKSRPGSSADCSTFVDDENTSYAIKEIIGRGSFGYAVLASKTVVTRSSSGRSRKRGGRRRGKGGGGGGGAVGGEESSYVVLKVDRDVAFTLWEAHVHSTIIQRLQELRSNIGDDHYENLTDIYRDNFVPPSTLYLFKDSSVLCMGFAELGTMINVISSLHGQKAGHGFTPEEHEVLAAYLSCQMIQTVSFLHEMDFINSDIKTDNWVLRWVNDDDDGDDDDDDEGSHGRLQVCLIDFGKAKDLRPTAWQQKKIHNDSKKKSAIATGTNNESYAKTVQRVAYTGVAGAKTFGCPEMQDDDSSSASIARTTRDSPYVGPYDDKTSSSSTTDVSFYPSTSASSSGPKSAGLLSSQPPLWNYQADYFGVCACIHQLLYLQPMTLTEEPLQSCSRRGFACGNHGASEEYLAKRDHVRVPQCSLKRYWKKEVWSAVYLTLLNSVSVTDRVDLSHLPSLLRTLYIDEEDYFLIKAEVAINKLHAALKQKLPEKK